MKNFFSKLTIQKKLALVAIVLGFLAIFAGSPYDKTNITLNAKELALIAEKNEDNISVQNVADWIIKGKVDFRLIDTRTPEEYEKYHIPLAQNIQPADLMDQNFLPTDKLILYSNSNKKAIQSWFLLKAKKYNAAYILKGGLTAWENEILFPKLSSNPSAEQLDYFNKIKEVSKFFGGKPENTTDNKQNQPEIKQLPKLQMPANIPTGSGKKKRREGC